MLDELYMRDLADAMKVPAEPLPTGKVTVSGPQVETQPKQPEMGTITGIPQTSFEKALEASGVKLSELGDMIDQSAPGTLNTLLGREVPVIGNLKLRDFLPFVGSKDEGKLTGTPAALIAAGTGQPLRGQPVVSSTVGPDGRTYFSASGSPAMLSEDVGTAMVDVATLGLGKPLVAGAKKAVKATKGLPVGMSTKAVGEGVSDLGFYSAAKQAVDSIQQPKGTGEQFLKQIEKTPGVKPEEIKWTGLDDFLKSKKSVSKTEVQDYLNANRVEVEEVQMGSGQNPYPYRTADEWQGAINRAEKVGDFDESERLTNAWEAFEGLGLDDQTKFSKYTLPGGENYREILLTLPTSGSGGKRVRVYTQDGTSAIQVMSDADIQRMAESGRRRFEVLDEVNPQGTFQSQHFDQPNILAHMRVNDRVDADGKKVLFVEEVQSDWHQAGRKKGYASATKPYEVFDPKDGRPIATFATEKEAKAYADELGPQVDYAKSQGVPDAPFKGNWHELAMKRAIQLASEGGYERIAFTTGKTQAERFDLSKQINELSYRKMDDDLTMKLGDGVYYEISATDKTGKPALKQQVTEKELPEVVGKDLADKIIKGEGKDYPKGSISSGAKFFSGLDLQVGGEGMKGFYDDILPKFLNKYAKKWDAKTGMTKIQVESKGQAMADADLLEQLGTARDKVDTSGQVSVHYIDITPKMKESVLTKGQPLFAVGAGGAGAAATQEENE